MHMLLVLRKQSSKNYTIKLTNGTMGSKYCDTNYVRLLRARVPPFYYNVGMAQMGRGEAVIMPICLQNTGQSTALQDGLIIEIG